MNLVLPITPAEAAFGDFRLPHRRQEDWRWTDLHQLIDRAYPPVAKSRLDDAALRARAAGSPFAVPSRLVIADGRYRADLSVLPSDMGVTVVSRAVTPGGDDPIRALSDRFAVEELVVRVAAHATLSQPIEIAVLTTAEGASGFARIAVELGEGASATVIESHLGGDDAAVATSITCVDVGPGATLERLKVQMNGRGVVHLSNVEARLEAGAVLRDFTLTEGGRATRQQGFITFAGENAEAKVSGAYLLSGTQHADTRLVVDHAVPHCVSRELFKCVMDGRARGIFQGKVIVRPDAQKTDGKQSSNALLLSEEAEFDAKPELEIYADDVVCGHGATSGALDEDQLFYLRARGVPEAEAKSLLIAAFAGEAFDQITDEALRDVLRGLAESWLVSGRA